MSSRLRWFLIAIILVAASAWPVMRALRVSTKAAPNIVFILCDTLRADHLGAYGYDRGTTPQIDRFATEAAKFTHAISAAPWTPPSIASMFTGALPSVHGLNPPNNRQKAKQFSMRLNEQFKTLAEHLSERGYATISVTASPWFDPAFGLRQGFDRTEHVMRGTAAEVNTAAYRAIDELSNTSRPFFLYLHYMDVHKRGDNPLAPFSQFKAQPLARWDYPADILEQIAMYDAELRYFDDYFGQVMDYLRSKNLYENSVIVLTSDHGEQFGERGKLGHGFNLHTEELRVPLILKSPGMRGENSSLVSNRDIFFTLLEAADIELPHDSNAASLLNSKELAARPGVLSEASRYKTFKSITTHNLQRLILRFPHSDPTKRIETLEGMEVEGLFDPVNDPKELTSISDQGAIDKTRALFVAQFEQAIKGEVATEHTEVSDDALKELETLGYLH
ncbi:MAG: sulfatase [Oligoflexia bacterium]|nr:sulfatase [Oligoflexia bacterium]